MCDDSSPELINEPEGLTCVVLIADRTGGYPFSVILLILAWKRPRYLSE